MLGESSSSSFLLNDCFVWEIMEAEEFSFQADGMKQDVFVPASLGVLSKSADVLLAEVRAGALRQDPAEEAATLLTGADRGSLSGEDLA